MLDRIRFRVRTGGEESEWKIEGLSEDGYGLWLTKTGSEAPREIPAGNTTGGNPVLMLSEWPLGTSGMIMTSWASTLPVELIK